MEFIKQLINSINLTRRQVVFIIAAVAPTTTHPSYMSYLWQGRI